MPTPRNDSAASVTTETGISRVEKTIAGAITFGSRSMNMIRKLPAPERAGRLDELALAQRDHLPADDPGYRSPSRKSR